jgi:hypothetical protein
MAIRMFDEQRIALAVEDVEAVAYELQGSLVSDADVARMGERLNGLAMTAIEDLLDGGDTSAIGLGMSGNFRELLEGSSLSAPGMTFITPTNGGSRSCSQDCMNLRPSLYLPTCSTDGGWGNAH